MKTTQHNTKSAAVIVCLLLMAITCSRSYAVPEKGINYPGNTADYLSFKGSTSIDRHPGITANSLPAVDEINDFAHNQVLSTYIETADCLSAPIAYEIWGSGEYCGAVGFEFGIYNSETDVTYFLYHNLAMKGIWYWVQNKPARVDL